MYKYLPQCQGIHSYRLYCICSSTKYIFEAYLNIAVHVINSRNALLNIPLHFLIDTSKITCKQFTFLVSIANTILKANDVVDIRYYPKFVYILHFTFSNKSMHTHNVNKTRISTRYIHSNSHCKAVTNHTWMLIISVSILLSIDFNIRSNQAGKLNAVFTGSVFYLLPVILYSRINCTFYVRRSRKLYIVDFCMIVIRMCFNCTVCRHVQLCEEIIHKYETIL